MHMAALAVADLMAAAKQAVVVAQQVTVIQLNLVQTAVAVAASEACVDMLMFQIN